MNHSGIPEFLADKEWKIVLILGVLCLTAYLPALNNGFIADDYVLLERTREIRLDPFFLFRIPPDIFRATTYLAFGVLKRLFGYDAAFFYAFTVLLHLANSLLLHRLLLQVTGRAETAALGAIFFAVYQNPQEAIMWLSAMNEALLGLFVLATLLLWNKGRCAAAGLTYLVALFSKESALMILGLVPLVEISANGHFKFRRALVYLVVPTLVLTGVFIFTMPLNSMLSQGVYAVGWKAFTVIVRSMHRVMFPWFYLAAAISVYLKRRSFPTLVSGPLIWMMIAFVPYIFLTYQNHVPSRHEYMASMGLVCGLAILVGQWCRPLLSRAFLVIFIAGNISYLWTVKDAAYERRAAPTTLLIRELRQHPPGNVDIEDFPFNPWVAKMTTRLVPGWQPEMISVDRAAGSCGDCLRLRWNPATQRYMRER